MRRRSSRAKLAALSCVCLTGGSALAADAPEVDSAPPRQVQEPEEREAPQVRRAPEGAPALQMSPDFASPAMSFGGYFPVPQMESGTMRVEPFNIRAAVNAGLAYDDNVTLTRSNKISSLLLTVTPAVSVGLEGANQRYYAVYRGNYGRYLTSSVDNFENHSFGVVAGHDWTTRLTSLATYDYTRGRDPRGATTETLTRSDPWTLHRLRGNAAYGAPGAQGRLEGFAAYTKREYSGANGGAPDARNFEQVDVGGTFAYRVAPKTSGTLTAQHSDITHPDAHVLDATENRVMVGVVWEAMAKTNGYGRVGYLRREGSDPAAGNFSTPTYEVGATWSPLTYSTLNVTANRTSAEAVEAGSRFLVVDTASATWDHSWFERVRSTVRGLYGQQRHEGLSRTDSYYTVGAQVSYALHRRLRVGAEIRHDARNSPDPLLEFKRNLTVLTLESSL
jgi:hypothetical protein